jgi:hypothetical protein
MSRLPRVPPDTVRDQLPAADRAGRLASWAKPSRRCISCPTADQRLVAWRAFVAGSARCASDQRALSLPAPRADEIPRFPDGTELPPRLPVLPHTAVMRQHLLTAEGPEKHGGCPG